MEILDEETVSQSGCFRRVRRWLKGIHPELGIIVRGFTGWETLQEISVVKAMQTFEVTDFSNHLESIKNREECPEKQTSL